MDIVMAAWFLLALQLASVAFLVSVLGRQIPRLKAPAAHGELITRYLLLTLVVVILIGNLIPIGVDTATIFGDLERSSQVLNNFGVAYSFSNAITAVMSAAAIWLIYKFIELFDAKEKNEKPTHKNS